MQIFGESSLNPAVTLVRYSKVIGYTESAFFGVADEKNARFACRQVWSYQERDTIEQYLCEAQDMIESTIQYPLVPTWFANERHVISNPVIADWGKIIDVGTKNEEVLSDDAVVDLTVEPAEIQFSIANIPSDLRDIRIFYPDTDKEIYPKNIELVASSFGAVDLLIKIPRARLVEFSKLENPEEGWLFTDDTNFQSTVDVHSISTDPLVQALLIYRDPCGDDSCTEKVGSACEYIDNPEVGIVRIGSVTSCSPKPYSHVLLNYRAGLTSLTRKAESAVIRLAHSLLPNQPCGCDEVRALWLRDREVPKILTQARIDCPYGMSDGAWVAWKFACGMELKRMTNLTGAYRD